MATAPQAGCRTPADLAAWNLPSEAAFDWNSPQVTVVDYISNFPTIDDDEQELVVAVSRLQQGGQWHDGGWCGDDGGGEYSDAAVGGLSY